MKPKISRLSTLASVLIGVGASVTAHAAELFFDGTSNTDPGNGASAGVGGTWNTTLTNWDVGAVPHVAWNNTTNAADTAVFGNLGNSAVTVTAGTVSAGGLKFSSTGGGTTTRWTLSTGPITLADGATVDGSAMDSKREATISLNAVLTGGGANGLSFIGGSTINGVAYASNFNSLTQTPRVNCLSLGGANTFTGPVTITNVVEAPNQGGSVKAFGAVSNDVTLKERALLAFSQATYSFGHKLIIDGINNAVTTHNTSTVFTLSGDVVSKNGASDVFW
ncbi:MAG: hypothetical protein J0M04_19565 [Verrucomicrobia bacterium]|nr:hypothetical protein [Verrucomicrobiota bacterium]